MPPSRYAVFQDVQLRIGQARHRLEDRVEELSLHKEILLRSKVSGFGFSFVPQSH